jgi:hypothetical protein
VLKRNVWTDFTLTFGTRVLHLIQINHQPDANFSVYYPDVCLQLNMFRAFSLPSSGAQWLQWRTLVLPSYRRDNRAVFVVGPAGPNTNTARRVCSMFKILSNYLLKTIYKMQHLEDSVTPDLYIGRTVLKG